MIDEGRTCVLDASPQSLKLLRNSSEFMPFVVFLSAPGLDEMRHVYDNMRVTNSMMNTGKSMSTFERTSSIRWDDYFYFKGQLISKGLFGVFNSSKKTMKTIQLEVP